MVAGEDVGRLGHEVDAAEHDELGLGALLGEHREPERVAPGVGPAHDLVPLVVVAEDEESVTEGVLGGRDAVSQVVRGRVRQTAQRAALAAGAWMFLPEKAPM